MEQETKEEELCCICGEKAEHRCSYCDNAYCTKHYKSVVMTGNCCGSNEKDYN
jgi:hypothetical protein